MEPQKYCLTKPDIYGRGRTHPNRDGQTWLASGTWDVEDVPCPDCGHYMVMGFKDYTITGEHYHTRYICRFRNCGWIGYFVPQEGQ